MAGAVGHELIYLGGYTHRLNEAYSIVAHWKRNIFSVPSGNAGKSFVSELARQHRSYAEGSALESIALKAATVMCILLLQKPTRTSKSCDHVNCIERRLPLWKSGNIAELLFEGMTIQQRLCSRRKDDKKDSQNTC